MAPENDIRPSRHILYATAKPGITGCFGGDDTFLIQFVNYWPAPADRITVAMNAGYPAKEIIFPQIEKRATLVLLEEEMVQEIKDRVIPRFQYPAARHAVNFLLDLLRPWQAARSIITFCGFLRRTKPDIFYLQGAGDFGWRFLVAAWLMRVPRVIFVFHNAIGRGTNRLRSFFLYLTGKITPYLCDTITVPSKACGLSVADYLRGNQEPLCIPYGVPPHGPTASVEVKRKALGLSEGAVIGCIGNLQPRKGLDVLIAAMPQVLSEIPDATCVIIGQFFEPHHRELERLIGELHLEKQVRLLGFLPDAAQYTECFDVCAIPSIAFEGLPLVALEAMRYARPIVAATTGGLPEAVVEGETGYLVPPGNRERLADRLIALLKSPDLRAQMGRRAHERFLDRFTTDRMIQRFFSLAAS